MEASRGAGPGVLLRSTGKAGRLAEKAADRPAALPAHFQYAHRFPTKSKAFITVVGAVQAAAIAAQLAALLASVLTPGQRYVDVLHALVYAAAMALCLGVRLRVGAFVRLAYYEFNMLLDVEAQAFAQVAVAFMAPMRYFEGDRAATSLAALALSAAALGLSCAVLTAWLVLYLWVRYYYQ